MVGVVGGREHAGEQRRCRCRAARTRAPFLTAETASQCLTFSWTVLGNPAGQRSWLIHPRKLPPRSRWRKPDAASTVFPLIDGLVTPISRLITAPCKDPANRCA